MSEATMGVDPGVSGGIAVLAADGAIAWLLTVRPRMSEKVLRDEIRQAIEALKLYGGRRCYMEKVGFIKGDGGKGSFTFGGVYRFVRAVLLSCDVQISDVAPALWQSKMECLTGGNKNVSKRRACELFPSVRRMTHAIADALLIAEYGRRRHNLSA